MKLNYDKKSSNPTYFVQHGYRNGKKTTTKNIYRIGRHDDLVSQGIDDPLEYAKQIVEEYRLEHQKNKIKYTQTIDYNAVLKQNDNEEDVSKSTSKNIGYFYLESIYKQLGITNILNEHFKDTKVEFNYDTIFKYLIFDRIMNPGSKRHTVSNKYKYYQEPNFTHQHILRFMDGLYKVKNKLVEETYINSDKIVKRDKSVFFYDCTNYYFETETQDDDYIDEVTGEFIKPLRKYGVSKEHRPSPIVQMGLFMDNDGIPITFGINPGNTNEQITAIPLEKEVIKLVKGKKFVYCADGGLNSTDIRLFNSMGGRCFIVTDSPKKLKGAYKDAIFNDYGYKLMSSNESYSLEKFKTFDKLNPDNYKLYIDKLYKEIIVDKEVDTGLFENVKLLSGKTKSKAVKATLKQKIIITFDRKTYEYQRKIREKQIERAEKIIKKMNSTEYKNSPNDAKRFIKRLKDENKKEVYQINQELIDKESAYDGYYLIATNLDDDAQIIISASTNRYKIEECFRHLKTNFRSRPVHHRLDDRIHSHFVICFISLLIYRLLEKKVNTVSEKKYTIEQIISQLNNMNVANINDIYNHSLYSSSNLLNTLNQVFKSQLNRVAYSNSSLNKILKNI